MGKVLRHSRLVDCQQIGRFLRNSWIQAAPKVERGLPEEVQLEHGLMVQLNARLSMVLASKVSLGKAGLPILTTRAVNNDSRSKVLEQAHAQLLRLKIEDPPYIAIDRTACFTKRKR
jgi:hypothetical protein